MNLLQGTSSEEGKGRTIMLGRARISLERTTFINNGERLQR